MVSEQSILEVKAVKTSLHIEVFLWGLCVCICLQISIYRHV